MHKLIRTLLGRLNITVALTFAIAMTVGATFVLAASTSSFTQIINPGTLAVDIVNASYVSVASPVVAMTDATFSFSCQSSTGTFGTTTEQILVRNPHAANDGWVVSLAAATTSAVWDGAASDFDFNDPTSSGCTDSADAGDAVGGQMTVDPSVGTLAAGPCAVCTTANITKGSSAAFNEGTTDTITVLNAAAASNDVGIWKLTGVSISQTIPAEQEAASDYDINMVLTIVAS